MTNVANILKYRFPQTNERKSLAFPCYIGNCTCTANISIKVKVKLSLSLTKHDTMKACWGRGDIAPHILDLGLD
jgi:hypothetical protein